MCVFPYIKSHIPLVSCMTASRVQNCPTTTSHTCYKPSNDVLGYSIPLLNQCLSKLCQGDWTLCSIIQTPPQLIPRIFDVIKVWGARWPIHSLISSLFMRFRTIIAQCGRALSSINVKFALFPRKKKHNICVDDLVDITLTFESPIDDH